MVNASQIDFNQFLKDNALYLALGVAGVILIILLIVILRSAKNRKDGDKGGKKKINGSA